MKKGSMAAAVLLLVALCGGWGQAVVDAAVSSGNTRPSAVKTQVLASSSQQQHQQHLTRVLLAEREPAAVGDDDEFDWNGGTKPGTADPNKPRAAAAAAAPTAAAPAPTAAAAAAAAKGAKQPQQQPTSSSSNTASSGPQPAAVSSAPKQPAAAPAKQPADEPKQALLPGDAGAPATQAAATTPAGQQQQPQQGSKPQAGPAAAAADDGDEGEDGPDDDDDDGGDAKLPTDDSGDNKPAQERTAAPANERPTTTDSNKQQQQHQAEGKQDKAQDSQGSENSAAAAAGDNKADDIDPTGACKSWVSRYCEDVDTGSGQLADCLSQHHAAAESGETANNAKLELLSEECYEEVLQAKIKRGKSVENNPALGKACADDINKYCKVTWYDGMSTGNVMSCLRDVKAALKPGCKKEVFKLQLDGANDYRADDGLRAACESDASALCQGVKHGGGQIQACLRKQRDKLSPDCESELFRKEVEDADDIRLSVRLFQACLPDKKQFCADVPPGGARASQCLEEHREKLSEGCRTEMDSMIERRVRDFRLDTRLKSACENTIMDMCSYLGDVTVVDTYDSAVANCLQDFREDIKDDACKAQVHRYIELAAQDIRFNVPLADACYQDRVDLCGNVPPGSARVIRCLQNQRDKLSAVCRSTLFTEMVRFSENIDFQYPMKQACATEMKQFCEDVPHGGARVIRCLQDNLKKKGFGKACKDEVSRYQQESGRDYRLNNRLHKACKQDVAAICADACDVPEGEMCGGKVLACLSEKQDEIKSNTCKKEVTYFERMGMQDFRADMQLAEACRPDVDLLCADVEPGEGRVHACLRKHFDKLSDACKREEVRLESKESDSIQHNTGLLHTCSAERSLFCKDVAPGSARVFRCLAHNMASGDFGSGCRSALLTKLRRREANWRLDPPLRKACREDVDSLCSTEDAMMTQDGAVKKCLIEASDSLSNGCRRELGRSMYMAFFIWQPQGLLTAPCDDDIKKLCLSGSKQQGGEVTPGAVETCLSEIVDHMASTDTSHRRHLMGDAAGDRKTDPKQRPTGVALPSSNTTARHMPRLSGQCYHLASLAHISKAERMPDFATAAYELLEASMGKVQAATGLQTLQQDGKTGKVSVSLTGWTALAGVASLVVLLSTVAAWLWRVNNPKSKGYALLVKGVPALPLKS